MHSRYKYTCKNLRIMDLFSSLLMALLKALQVKVYISLISMLFYEHTDECTSDVDTSLQLEIIELKINTFY